MIPTLKLACSVKLCIHDNSWLRWSVEKLEKSTNFEIEACHSLQLREEKVPPLPENVNSIPQYVSCAMLPVRKKRVAVRMKILDTKFSLFEHMSKLFLTRAVIAWVPR